MTRVGASGRDLSEVTLEAVQENEVTMADLSIHPDTLEHQANVAKAHGNPQLAANFRRAAELTALPDEEVLALYEALRPHRSTSEELAAIAHSLQGRGAVLVAELFSEAASVYARRGLLRH